MYRDRGWDFLNSTYHLLLNHQDYKSHFNIPRNCIIFVENVLENALHSQISKVYQIINSCPITENHTSSSNWWHAQYTNDNNSARCIVPGLAGVIHILLNNWIPIRFVWMNVLYIAGCFTNFRFRIEQFLHKRQSSHRGKTNSRTTNSFSVIIGLSLWMCFYVAVIVFPPRCIIENMAAVGFQGDPWTGSVTCYRSCKLPEETMCNALHWWWVSIDRVRDDGVRCIEITDCSSSEHSNNSLVLQNYMLRDNVGSRNCWPPFSLPDIGSPLQCFLWLHSNPRGDILSTARGCKYLAGESGYLNLWNIICIHSSWLVLDSPHHFCVISADTITNSIIVLTSEWIK
jgi:hypothetical protein